MWLTREQIETMYAHAKEAYPNECCGLIVGPRLANEGAGRNGLRLLLCQNIQDEMHKRDPESYPRSARKAFFIDPVEFAHIVREADERKEVIRGIFHSHPDEEAYFSQEDKDAAVPFGDLPSFPDAEHIVISVRDGEIKGYKVFLWDREKKEFLPAESELKEGREH